MTASVLYVDDDRNLCQIVAKALREEGYTARTAFDGDDAIAQIRDDPPDLLLLDVLLPRRDGFEVLAEIRGLSGPASQLPCALVTGCTPTPAYTQRASELGALELLSKPVPLETLFELVVRHVGEAKPPPPAGRAPSRKRRAKGIAGRLDRIPFPAVLHHLHGLRATGVLQLACEKRRKWIQLRDGYPVAVRSNMVRETLGHLLVRSGRISREDFDASRRQMKSEDRRHGEILVAMEVLSEEEVAAALHQQADEKLFELFAWTRGSFRFERGARLQRANSLDPERSPADLILQGVRSRFPIDRIDRYLAHHGDRAVGVGESRFYRFQDVHIDPEEEALLRKLDGNQRLSDLSQETESLRRTTYGLLAVGLLELKGAGGRAHTARRAAEVPTQRPVARPGTGERVSSQADPDRPHDPRIAQLTELAERLRSSSHFETLEVEETSSDDDLRRAFERLSARTHPDRFSGASQTVKDLAGEVYGLVTEAYETLSDPRRRQQYLLDRRQEQRAEKERRRGERALEAETEFRKGQAALQVRDYESALAHFGRALQLYPDEGDHHAHYGWALYLCHPGDASIVGEALEHVRKGLKLASHREKPYLFMGRLYKAIGRADVAEKMFTRAVHIQPECVEALRELRLMNMRRSKSKGLLGRLLRR